MTQNYYFSAKQNAKRLHGVPIWLSHDVQSPCHRVSHTMTNKTRRKVAVKQQQKKKATPFADAGAIVGSKVSTMFNAPWAKGVGKWLGSGIGQIFGSGDYTMAGPSPQYNILTNGNQIPKFSTTHQTNLVCHREYLGDITGTTAFTNRQYPLNPGMAATFPWLSTIAQNYQEYKIHGLIFEFRPLITDFVTSGAPGVIIMATNYNADAPVYNTKQQMENSEFAVSCKPTIDLIHGVECATDQVTIPHRYVRTGTPPSNQDLRLYDYGTFQFASQTNPVQNLGELWVSYAIEFFKPVLPEDVGGNIQSVHATRTTITGADPFGSVAFDQDGDLGAVITTTSVTFPVQPGNVYLFDVAWTGVVGAVAAYPVISFTGASAQPYWTTIKANALTSPGAGTTTTSMNYQVVLVAGTTSTSVVATANAAGVFPGAGAGVNVVDITITQLSTEAL